MAEKKIYWMTLHCDSYRWATWANVFHKRAELVISRDGDVIEVVGHEDRTEYVYEREATPSELALAEPI